MVDGPIGVALRGKAVLLCLPPTQEEDIWASPEQREAISAAFTEHGAAIYETRDPKQRLPEELRRLHDTVEAAIVFPGAPAAPSEDLSAAIKGRAWPVVGLLQSVHGATGHYPRYTIALSSMLPARYEAGAEARAVADSVLEILCRYVTADLLNEDARVNAIRPGPGASAAEVAGVAVALCTGLLDGVKGQILTVDGGRGFSAPGSGTSHDTDHR